MAENKKSLSFFMKSEAEKKKERVSIVISNRFKDEDGNPVPFELKVLSGAEIMKLQKNATRVIQSGLEYDTAKFAKDLVEACVVFPNLNDASLQDSYGVMGAMDLLNEMLDGREFTKLFGKCQEINGMQQSLDDLVSEAKN